MGREIDIENLRERIASIESSDCRQSEAPAGKQIPNEPAAALSDHFNTSQSDDAFARIIRLSSVRDRCQSELHERLLKEDYRSADIEEALSRAVRCGLVDDLRFADMLVRSRISSGKGAASISRELERRGIDPFLLEGWPEAYGCDRDAQIDRAVSFLSRKPPHGNNLRSAAYRKLAAKGYSQEVSTVAARTWCASL